MRYFSFLLPLLCFFQLSGQLADSSLRKFKHAEQELKSLQKKVFYSRSDQEKLEGNKEFMAIWDRIIVDPKIIQYPFDSLREISVLRAPDGKFSLLTWNLPRTDGTHVFFGYLMVNNSRTVKKGLFKSEKIDSYESYKLLDRSMTVKSPENYIGTPAKWFGMLYTQLIPCEDYYALIGWDGNDKLTQRKFIDVLYFKSNGDPVFGKDVFRIPRKNPRRLMFEWSQEVSMSLKYSEKENRIIYSHLASNQEGSLLDGQFQFYGPDGSFDALELKKGRWAVVEDIDARTQKGNYDKSKKPNPKKQKPMYVPH